MADKKISQLTAATTPLSGTEVVPIVQGGSTVKTPVSDLTAGRAVTMLSATLTGGVVNGVVYLNASKVTTSGTALTFDGTTLNVSAGSPVILVTASTTGAFYGFEFNGGALDAFIKAQPSNAELRISSGRSAGWGGFMSFYTDTLERARITPAGNVVAGGSVALTTTATDGFLYVPTCAGTPTGTPTAITGMAPIVVNTTNNKLYFYSGGVWRDAGP